MTINRRTLITAGAATLAFTLAALPAHAMPGDDDNMDSWPQKLKEVANPAAVANPVELQQQQKINRVRVNPEPQPWRLRTLNNGQ